MRRQVSPKVVAFSILVVLGIIQLLYWRGLVWQPKGSPQMKGGGISMQPPAAAHGGLKEALVETLAGDGTPGYQDGRTYRARFDGPAAIASGPDGCLYVADSRNHRIRRITPEGVVTTVAGGGPVATLAGSFADGPVEESRFRLPAGIAVARSGDIYVADTGNHRLRLIRGGKVSTLAGGDTPRDEDGFPGGGYADGPGSSARFHSPAGLALDVSGNLYVADVGNQAIRKVAPGGTVNTLAHGAPLVAPSALCLLPDGSLMVADPGQGKLFALSGGSLQPVGDGQIIWPNFHSDPAGLGQFRLQQPSAIVEAADGLLYVADSTWNSLFFLTPDRKAFLVAGSVILGHPSGGYYDGSGEKAGFLTPVSFASGPRGTLYVADFGNNCIRKLTAHISPDLLLSPSPPSRPGGARWLQERGTGAHRNRLSPGSQFSPGGDIRGKERNP